MRILNRFLLTALSLGCAHTVTAGVPVYQDESRPIEERVEDALSRMTLHEKIAMCHAQGKFSSPGVPRLGIPDLWMSDGPHGVRAEINWNDWGYSKRTNDSITAFPALTALAATWNPSLAASYGNALAEEALYREKDVMLGPGVNIYRTPLNGRNFEYLGEDPCLAGEMVVPYIRSMQQAGVAACVKHFALNNQEKWRGHIDVNLSDRALHEIYLPAFRRAVVDGGAWSIMGAYNKVRGQHACHNELLLNDILKRDWGFDGVVITDWGGTHDTREAALYGLDLEMGTSTNGLTTEGTVTTDEYFLANPYQRMIQNGDLPAEGLDDKVRRLLRLNFRTASRRDKPYGSLCTPEHYAVAEEIGNEAIVLLKNEPVRRGKKIRPLLPLDTTLYSRILVVGENATRNLMAGGGSSELKPKDIVTPLDGLKKALGDRVVYTRGYASGKPSYGHANPVPKALCDSLHDAAVNLAQSADLVIFIGGLNKNHGQDCEGGDREEYSLPFGQPRLIEDISKVNPDVVMVLLSGNAVETDWAERVPAILQGWYLGSMGGKSLASVITGKVNPSGKLPFTFPVRLSDSPAHSFGEIAYPGDSIRQEYLEDILIGYRWHDTQKIAPRFPFGHGLSYTRFSYGKPVVSTTSMAAGDTVRIEIPVRNTGALEGKETVQLYIGDDEASLMRPVKELKGFKKITVSPGEEETAVFDITVDDLKFYDDRAGKWTAEPGGFKAYIGSSSADIRATVPFTLLPQVNP